MIAYLFVIVLLLFLPYLAGRLIQKLIHTEESDNRCTYAGAFLSGSFVLLFLFFVIQIFVLLSGGSYAQLKWVYLALLVLIAIAAMLVCKKDMLIVPVRRQGMELWLFLAAAAVFMLLVVTTQLYEPYFGSDMTVEIAVTTQTTGTIYRFHPATGDLLELEMNSIAKLDILPVFYAVIGDLSGTPLRTLICGLIPIWNLLLHYAAVSLILRGFLKKSELRTLAMLFYGVLMLAGDYQSFTYAFRLLHQGFSAATFYPLTGGMTLLVGFSLFAGRRCRS